MDLALDTDSIHGLEAKFESVGSKRSVETGELTVAFNKKARCGIAELRRVAELVLVLSAMAEMRGGRMPVVMELEMMAVARAKVAVMCNDLAPDNVVEREGIGAVIEDFGLNCVANDQNLEFRSSKVSILEKYLLAKHRMEESKEFASHSGTHLSHCLQIGTGAAVVSRGTSLTNGMRLKDKSSHAPIASGGFSTDALVGSSRYQLSTNQNKPSMISSGLSFNNFEGDSSSLTPHRVDRANFRLDPGVRPVQDSSIDHTSIKGDGTVSAVMPQAPPLAETHKEIGNIIHKFLQSRLQKQPTWTLPSRDYMSKALSCQICQLALNEVENVLVCDACEKGFHLKCLQAYNQKESPRGEWQCHTCLMLNNGKPLPSKYGRVMRNESSTKAASVVKSDA